MDDRSFRYLPISYLYADRISLCEAVSSSQCVCQLRCVASCHMDDVHVDRLRAR